MTSGEPTPSFVAAIDQPLIGVIVREGDHEVVHYFTDEGVAADDEDVRLARALAGAWNDLDWGAMDLEFDRIRHDSRPTPPISEL